MATSLAAMRTHLMYLCPLPKWYFYAIPFEDPHQMRSVLALRRSVRGWRDFKLITTDYAESNGISGEQRTATQPPDTRTGENRALWQDTAYFLRVSLSVISFTAGICTIPAVVRRSRSEFPPGRSVLT